MNQTAHTSGLSGNASEDASPQHVDPGPPSGEELLSLLRGVTQARQAGLVMTNGRMYETRRGVAWDATLKVDGRKAYRIWNDGMGGESVCEAAASKPPAAGEVSRRLAAIEYFGKQLFELRSAQLQDLKALEQKGEVLEGFLAQGMARLKGLHTTGLPHDEEDLCELLDMYSTAMLEYETIARKAKKRLVVWIDGQPRYGVFKASDSPELRARATAKFAPARLVFLNDLVA